MIQLKKCSKCGNFKNLKCFNKDKASYDGYHSSCAGCRNTPSFYLIWKKELENYGYRQCTKCFKLKKLYKFNGKRCECKECKTNYNNLYYDKNKKHILYEIKKRHKQEPWLLIFKWIKDRCELSSSTAYKYYGGKGIKCLITVDELKELWFRDKAYDMNRPSIDRKDNNGNYTYKNCRFIELSKNIAKMNKDNNKYRKILQYDLEGNFIKEWSSITKAQLIYGHCIIDCLSGRTKSSKNFIWKYKDN